MDFMGERGNWIAWTVDDWADWLRERIEERKQVFLSDPDELIAGFNREKSHESGYHGRELIELIQNADDAGIDYTGPNRLLIKLTDFGLFVANTGVPFSPKGIKSLMVSDNSPKQLLRTKCIGYKGLGFRSILGWASSIIILSGKVSIGFNEKFAEKWLRNLRRENRKVDVKAREYENSGYPAPIATLSIPYLITSENAQSDTVLHSIYEEGAKIIESGYDTVVCLLFKNSEKTREQVQKQINSLGSEILLFLQFLEKIEIQSPEKNEVWTVERKENLIVVNPDSTNPEIWQLFKREDSIPKEYLKPEQVLHDKYEIKLAIPSTPTEINRLFVFFPTEVRFPFPLIVHATFEVDDSRKHLIDSEVNRFITGQLADLMAVAAEKIKNPDNPWHALSTISPRGDIDPILEKFGFLDLLKENAKKYAIIPVRNSYFETASKAKRIRGNFDTLLTGDPFRDLCMHVANRFIDNQLDHLNVNYLQYGELRNRLNSISDALTMNQRAELIYLLVENNLIEGEPSEILIDSDNRRISSQSPVFLPPEAKTFALPDWVPQRILNSELLSLLRDKFRISRIRDLRLKLELFNVKEYNLNAFVSAIQAENNRRCKEKPDEELILRRQAIQLIWNLYSSSEEKGRLEGITIILPTRTNKFDSARNLYFGREYKYGKILEYLYAHVNPDSFIAGPDKLGFSDSSKETEDFLCWLGVNNDLQQSVIDISSYGNDFIEHVIYSLKYPAKFNEITVENINEFTTKYENLKDVTQIEQLKQILDTADPHAILCWIAVNPDVDSWRIEGDKNAVFEIKGSHQQYYRKLLNQSVPSYPLWLLRTTKWMPVEGGGKMSPNKCCLARGAKDISPVIGFPAVNMEHPLIKELNLDPTAIKNAMIRIGVVTDLDELPWDSFYEVLLELPNLDPEGNKARSIYRKLFGRTEGDITPAGERYNEFMSKGQMLGKKKGEIKYYPTKQLYYLENITLPKNIADQYPLLELDKRRGADKVKRIFGVEQLTRDKIQIEITSFEEHPCSQNFQSEIERLKPCIYALRVEEDANRAQLGALKRLKVNLCKSVRVAMLIDDRKEEIDLQNGDSINIDSEAYLVAEPSDYMRPLLEDHLIADSIGEIISNILKVDINSEIVNIATCPTNKRLSYLDRIAGGSGNERLTKAKELLKIPLEDYEEPIFTPPPAWQPPAETETKEDKKEIPGAEMKPQSSFVGEVSAVDKGLITPSQKRLVIRKIQLNPKTSSPSHAKGRVNADRAENLAFEFEKEEKRYPKKISHIRGFDSFGCDLLSFKTENDFNNFQKNSDVNLVDRFIEVKGSSSEKGSVILKGNELRSAQAYKDKFYIYRLYEDEATGICDLVMINDPLDCEKDALEPQYEINPFHSAKSHLWEVEEKDIVNIRE